MLQTKHENAAINLNILLTNNKIHERFRKWVY